jgi:hypothetical protein
VRGPGGGFQLLDGHAPPLPDPRGWQPKEQRAGRALRAEVQVTLEGRRLAAVLGRLQPMRVRRQATDADSDGHWLDATFRIDTIESAVIDVLSLGPHIRVIAPTALRDAVAERARGTAALYPPVGWLDVRRPSR